MIEAHSNFYAYVCNSKISCIFALYFLRSWQIPLKKTQVIRHKKIFTLLFIKKNLLFFVQNCLLIKKNIMQMKKYFYSLLFLFVFQNVFAQDSEKISFSGALQSDMLFPQEYQNSDKTPDKFLSNNYLDLHLNSAYINAGIRLELLHKPLPGFEKEFAGAGLPNIFVTAKYKKYSLTLGNFYEQFGSGFILRNYEERSLGIDNSLRGARFMMQPYKGIAFKLLGGVQRQYFNYGSKNAFGFDFTQGAVWGSDLELNIDEWVPKLQQKSWNILVGSSFVSRFQPDEDIYRLGDNFSKLNLPKNVAATDFRVRIQQGNWSVLAEYAFKANDPSADNCYIYKNGSALLLSATYSQKGLSALFQAKRSDNMSFRSVRSSISPTSTFINHLPAFTQTHTYALAALYPYATQPTGEWAFQGNFGYNFKKGTKMGGKYGTNFKLNASYICGLKKDFLPDLDSNTYDPKFPSKPYYIMGSNGYKSKFFGFGNTYYFDVNVEFNKKISKTFSISANYLFQNYNKNVVEGKINLSNSISQKEQDTINANVVKSHIAIVEIKYQAHKNFALRAELQYLLKQSEGKFNEKNNGNSYGDWAFALVELSLFRSLMISLSDMYNLGNAAKKQHYYMISATYNLGAHRLQAGYVRTKEGYNCSGGVCRTIPAYKGFQISYNVIF